MEINLRILKLLLAETLLFLSIAGASVDEFTRFILLGFVGFFAGYVKSREMKKKRTLYNVLTCCLAGMVLTYIVVGIGFSHYIMPHPIRCFAISAGIGYFQPNLVDWFQTRILGQHS